MADQRNELVPPDETKGKPPSRGQGDNPLALPDEEQGPTEVELDPMTVTAEGPEPADEIEPYESSLRSPVTRPTDIEKREREQLRQEQAEQFADESESEAWRDARELNSLTKNAMDTLRVKSLEDDPSWDPDADTIQEIAGEDFNKDASIPDDRVDELYEEIANTTSRKQAEAVRDRWFEQQEAAERLQSQGLFKNLTYSIGASVADPTAVAAGVGASATLGPLGGAAIALTRAGKGVKTGLRISGIAGATAAGESGFQSLRAYEDNNAAMYAAILGGAGASLGPAFRAVPGATDKLTGMFKRSGDEAERLMENEIGQAYSGKSDAGSQDAGAAGVSRVTPLDNENLTTENFHEEFLKDPERVAPVTAFGKGRYSAMAQGKRSKNPLVRAVANNMAEDAVGNRNKNVPIQYGASERKVDYQNQKLAKWAKSNNVNQKKFREDNPGLTADEFQRRVTRHQRGVVDDPDPSVRDQARVMGELFDEMHTDLTNPGEYRGQVRRSVKGFEPEKGKYVENYVPRRADMDAQRSLVTEMGTPNLERVIAGAFRKATPEATDQEALRAASTWLNTRRKIDAGINNGHGSAEDILNEAGDDLAEKLTELDIMSRAEVEEIVEDLSITADRKADGSGDLTQSKRRMKMDEGFSMEVRRNPETGSGSRVVRVDELFDNDANRLMESYTRNTAGAVAMARMDIPGVANGITSRDDWTKIKNDARKYAIEHGHDVDETNKAMAQMDFLYESIRGNTKYNESNPWFQGMRRTRDWMFMSVMGASGWAQIPEIGTVMGAVGVRNLAKSVPEFGKFRRNALSGKLENRAAEEIESNMGYSTQWVQNSKYSRRHEVMGNMIGDTKGQSQFWNRVDQGLHTGTRGVSLASGLEPVSTVLQRFSVGAMQNRWGEAAVKGKLPWSRERLATMNLTERQASAVTAQIRQHAEMSESGVIKQMNYDKWDPDVAANYQEGLMRNARRVVQENDIGSMRQIMSHPIARSILQFRSFISNAYEKQLLHGVHQRDIQTLNQFLTSTFFGGMSHVARTKIASIGRDDEEKYLKQHLTWDEIGKASFERSSFSSIIPTALDPLGYNIFDSRTTGLSSGILGNPSAQAIDKLARSAQDVLTLDVDKATGQRLRSTIPLQNTVVVQQGLNLLFDQDVN